MVVARDKAYVLDGIVGSLIQWNPTTMEVEAQFRIPDDLEIPGPARGPIVGADRLLNAWATEDGDLLFSTGVRSTAYQVATEGLIGGPSCVLQVDGDDFSAAPIAPPRELTDGRVAGSYIFVSDNSAFVGE